jgi:uncharacterized protein
MIEMSDAAGVAVELSPVPIGQVVSGAPQTGFAALGELAGREYGVWEMTPGVMSDVEEDELFVVLSGSGTVELDGAVTPLARGSVVRLTAGMQTVWVVTETLRKVYVTGA